MENLIERIKEKYGNNEVFLPEEYCIFDDRGPMGSGSCANITKIRIDDDKPEFYLEWWDYGWKSPDELIERFSLILNEDKLRNILISVCPEETMCSRIPPRYYFISAFIVLLVSLMYIAFYNEEIPDQEGPKGFLTYTMVVIMPCSSISLLIKGIISNRTEKINSQVITMVKQ